ncbi:MAG: hypothetical protein IRZ10_09585 [Thermoflavifilum sp.]|nr:hypothetical protein [Thermoflavifilum sp.]MCL6514658.1 hypothetical protein [Alicyclobacillus sp.]
MTKSRRQQLYTVLFVLCLVAFFVSLCATGFWALQYYQDVSSATGTYDANFAAAFRQLADESRRTLMHWLISDAVTILLAVATLVLVVRSRRPTAS